jgi:hypothetical protein
VGTVKCPEDGEDCGGLGNCEGLAAGVSAAALVGSGAAAPGAGRCARAVSVVADRARAVDGDDGSGAVVPVAGAGADAVDCAGVESVAVACVSGRAVSLDCVSGRDRAISVD